MDAQADLTMRTCELSVSAVALAGQVKQVDILLLWHQEGGPSCACGRPTPCEAQQRLTMLRHFAVEVLAGCKGVFQQAGELGVRAVELSHLARSLRPGATTTPRPLPISGNRLGVLGSDKDAYSLAADDQSFRLEDEDG